MGDPPERFSPRSVEELPQGYEQWVADVAARVRATQFRIARGANADTIRLYAAADQPDAWSGGPADVRSPGWSAGDQPADHRDRHRDRDHDPDQGQRPDQDQPGQVRDRQDGTRTTVRTVPPPKTSVSALSPGSAAPPAAADRVVPRSRGQGGVQAS